MFVIVNDTTKSFIKPEYAVIQSSAMPHTYKWIITDVRSTKNIY